MLTTDQMNKYASVLLWGLKTARTERFKKGDIVLLRYDLLAVALAEVLYARLLESGFHVVLRSTMTARMERSFFEKATAKQLVFQNPGEKPLYEHIHGSIYLHAPESLTHLSGTDPRKLGKVAVSRKVFRDILDRREEKGEFGWTLCLWPTPALAKQAKLTLRQYKNQIIKACYLDQADPVKAWRATFRQAQAAKKWLNGMDVAYFHITSKHTDLKIVPGKQRKWIGISGHNIPSFELFLSPDWRGTEGTYFADQPSFRSGRYVEGVKLEFKKGRAVGIEARAGRDFVVEQLAMDEGACRVGEFSLTDKRFSKINRFMANTLYDENFGGRQGNCHIAVGAAYSDTYDGDPQTLTPNRKKQLGFNDSALHWDLVNTEKKCVVARLTSGASVKIYENGMFTYESASIHD